MKHIAYITDTHIDDHVAMDSGVDPKKNLELILQDIAEKNIDYIIHGGDAGEHAGPEWLFNKLEKYNVYISPGNHDHSPAIAGFVEANMNEDGLYHSFEDEGFKFIFMDSSQAEIQEKQTEWLKKELNTDKPVLIFIHHPILPVNTAIDNIYPLDNRQRIKAILESRDNNITIFCGHYHMQDEQASDNTRQIVTPAVSFQVKKEAIDIEIMNNTFGYRTITIDNGEMNTKLFLYREGRFESAD